MPRSIYERNFCNYIGIILWHFVFIEKILYMQEIVKFKWKFSKSNFYAKKSIIIANAVQ